jgi:hypothetical protein
VQGQPDGIVVSAVTDARDSMASDDGEPRKLLVKRVVYISCW